MVHTKARGEPMQKHRTDLAYEEILNLRESEAFTHAKKIYQGITTHHISIHEETEEIDKAVGEYITIELDNLDDGQTREAAVEVTVDCLKEVILGLPSEHHKVLVVGLGNQEITADSLGPLVAREVVVTSHLYRLEDASMTEGTREVAVIVPGVMGQTGLETAEFVQAVARQFEPDFVIAIDALATRSIERINRVIQITDTGIQPGAGVGNKRKTLNQSLLQIPVIAIGVATVVSIEALIDQVLSSIESHDYQKVMEHIQYNESYQMVVTPKEMDEDIKHLADVLSKAINYSLHPRFDQF